MKKIIFILSFGQLWGIEITEANPKLLAQAIKKAINLPKEQNLSIKSNDNLSDLYNLFEE